jgi:glucosamine--fructose-6-phosphate aminotransferase (isomerizing)
MCGIVGYIGQRQAFPILIKGLKRLEYRGYDSAGIALLEGERLEVYKAKGKVSNLEQSANDKNKKGCMGIAHTRWATHGEPSQKNAHPHCSNHQNLVIVHNGIIENYASLREGLIQRGYFFESETDTEVLVQLIDYVQREGQTDLPTAVQIALQKVIGAYAIVVMDKNHPHQMVAARKSSPLVIGIGDKEYFLASDATPIVEYTDQVVYLEDEEIAILDSEKDMRIINFSNDTIQPNIQQIDLNIGQLEKGGYPHFMLKEIFEQPDCIDDCMRGRINLSTKEITLSAVENYKEKWLKAKRIVIVACGTSWHAGLIGKQLLEEFCRIPVMVEYASEFRYNNPVITDKDIVIAISQSGETADTLAAIELAREKGAFIYGICNAIGSSIPRNTDTGSYIHVGPEIGVASTKAFTGQVTVLTMLALTLGDKKGTLDKTTYHKVVEELGKIPEKMRKALLLNDSIEKLSRTFTYAHNFIYLGRSYCYPVALEGALKLKEISYIHAEGYPAAEMKHGPIALIDSDMPVVAIAPSNGRYEKVVSNIQEIKARQGKVIAIVNEGDETICTIANHCIHVPATLACLDPMLTSIPLQLMAYHIAVQKGKDVDMPRNLAKSVTVE